LEPVWRRASYTGVRLHGMIEKVLAFAQFEGHIDEDCINPAIWSRLKDSLPNPDDLAKRLGKRHNQPAMPYADVPALARPLGRGPRGEALFAVAEANTDQTQPCCAIIYLLSHTTNIGTLPSARTSDV
jgi:hypothetical protein